ncbi:pilus assembly protein TadG-related protein [Vulgatibacter incomptus]|uniref:Putative Flp pilus-assembly TadG-like N-terminal domain-containing protein n=1 Tax=Vulgatibacter incomptus TaxID=1391653 RepID=A0A0K1PIU3_9BACT|nr:pilus assembly protein TadG-related protein [Vulgatibacter incomptus]AKU93311.1 hypothetical protein AKJ08_3698 [Vulgatibacter incomptus]
MLARIRRLSREEDGQALVLAALLLFAIAVAVLGTANLGHAVHERIQLQNAADNAAYSLAAHEARAFNFYAYTNRAQISQYVTIMQLLSVDSMVLGVLTALGALSAVLKTVGDICADWKREVCLAIPVIGDVLAGVSMAAEQIEKVVRAAGKLFTLFDAFVGSVAVPLLVGANLFLFANQATFHASVLATLADDGALRIARATSPHAELWLAGALQSIGNGARFAGAHLSEAARLGGTGGSPHTGLADGTEGRKNYARRGMSELIHATRSSGWVYDRSFPGMGALGRVTGAEYLDTLADLVPGFEIRGHTRLHSEAAPRPTSSSMKDYYRQMESTGQYTARYPTGSSIGANFYLNGKGLAADLMDALGLGMQHMASVTSTGTQSGGGWACTWDLENPYVEFPLIVLTIYGPRFTCDVNKGKHPWWGITPYMAFDPSGAGCEHHASEHCQPDVWVALKLPQSRVNLAPGGRSAAVDVEVGVPGGTARASNASGDEGGMKAVSRALAYYHRPGNWQEQPNFFNPFWRAKLAPVESGLDRLAHDAGVRDLRGLVPEGLVSKGLTH